MTVLDLAKLLLEKQGWTHQRLSKECGTSRQNIQRLISGKPRKKKGFYLGVLSAAFRYGLEAEAIHVIVGSTKALPSILRAVIMYPDITQEELAEIREAEKITHMDSLPSEVIRSIVAANREKKTGK